MNLSFSSRRFGSRATTAAWLTIWSISARARPGRDGLPVGRLGDDYLGDLRVDADGDAEVDLLAVLADGAERLADQGRFVAGDHDPRRVKRGDARTEDLGGLIGDQRRDISQSCRSP